MISQKRKPEEKIQKTLEKIKNKNPINNNLVNDILHKIDSKKKEKEKKRIINNDNSNKTKKRIKQIINKDKNKINKKKEKNINNANIDFYFDKKYMNEEQGKKKNNFYDNNNSNKTIYNKEKSFIIQINNAINKDSYFSLIKDNKVKYNIDYLNSIKDMPIEIKEFYSLNSNSINDNNKLKYISILKNYLSKYNSLNTFNQYNFINSNNKKLIFIQNSLVQLKKCPTKISTKINPRNFLAKDEFLIDYEKDSEDEFLEENAEDILSNEDNDNEEDDEELFSICQKEGLDFIVPDGHLSQDEISDENLIEERQLFQNPKNKYIDIKTILNIRKNYIKPIIVDFTKNEKNERILILTKKLTIGLFNFNCNNNIEYDYEYENNIIIDKVKFPIVINNKYKGIQDPIKNHFEYIVKIIHGSYDTKEHLISEIINKYDDISKNILNNFFKEKCLKISKKYWIVKNEILNEFNLNRNEIEEIKKVNYNIFKEKEEKKSTKFDKINKKEELFTLIRPQFLNSYSIEHENNYNTICNDKEKSCDMALAQRLDTVILNKKDYDEISIEILDTNSYKSNEIEDNNKNIIFDFDDNKDKLNNAGDDDIKKKEENQKEENVILSKEKLKKTFQNIKINKSKKSKIKKERCVDYESFIVNENYTVDVKKKYNKKNIDKKGKISKIKDLSKIGKATKIGKINKIEKMMKNVGIKNKSRNKNIKINNKLINEYFHLKEN